MRARCQFLRYLCERSLLDYETIIRIVESKDDRLFTYKFMVYPREDVLALTLGLWEEDMIQDLRKTVSYTDEEMEITTLPKNGRVLNERDMRSFMGKASFHKGVLSDPEKT